MSIFFVGFIWRDFVPAKGRISAFTIGSLYGAYNLALRYPRWHYQAGTGCLFDSSFVINDSISSQIGQAEKSNFWTVRDT